MASSNGMLFDGILPDPEPAILIFPTVGKVKEWSLTVTIAGELQEAFPHINIIVEARKALEWCRANPPRRKTANGMRRFLYSWLARAQNGHGERLSLGEQIKANGLEFIRRGAEHDAR